MKDSMDEKEIMNLSKNDPNLYFVRLQKCSTRLTRRKSYCFINNERDFNSECLILLQSIQLPEAIGHLTVLYFRNIWGKKFFRMKQLRNCIPTDEIKSVVYAIPELRKKACHKPEKLDALRFISYDGRKCLLKV